MVLKVMIAIMMMRIIMKIQKQFFIDVVQNRCFFLKIFANFTGKHLCQNFPMKFANFLKTSFLRTVPVAASENNEQQQLSVGFANNCYKIVSPIFPQELINDFGVCKHCSGTHLLVEDVPSSHGFGNQNYIFQKGATPRTCRIFILRCIKSIFFNCGNQFSLYRVSLESFIFAKQTQILSKQWILFLKEWRLFK